jgi:hypothetical protein
VPLAVHTSARSLGPGGILRLSWSRPDCKSRADGQSGPRAWAAAASEPLSRSPTQTRSTDEESDSPPECFTTSNTIGLALSRGTTA